MAKGTAGDNGNGEQKKIDLGKPSAKGAEQAAKPRSDEATKGPPGEATKETAGTAGKPRILNLVIPVLVVPGAYASTRIDINDLSPRRALAFRLLFDGLIARGARLADGTLVSNKSQNDSARWLLDQIADAAGL